MKIYDTAMRELVDFAPADGRQVRMYTCGPTVYNYMHIGNLRTFVFEDLLRRALQYEGYDVLQVMNLTDVDDKTIRGAIEAEVPLDTFTAPYKAAFFEDLDTLGIEPAEQYPAATDHIDAMVALIQRLVDSGHAYPSEDGSVYFSISRFDDYGALAHLNLDELKPGARVAQDEYEKDSVSDFALWKAWREADGDVAWDSPWGRGRPGWHIECSAMSMQYLGETFDLHTGGVDNIFPHHEDEIAQSECATGKTFVRHWMHANHLIVEGRKMSKSMGNFYTLRDLLKKGASARAVRYLLISAHYRQQLNFTFDGLRSAAASLGRIDEFVDRVRKAAGEAAAGVAPDWAQKAQDDFRTAVLDDLNTPEALAAVFQLITEGNRAMDAGDLPPEAASAIVAILQDVDRVLGLIERPDEEVPAALVEMMEARAAARAARDFAEADRLRDAIDAAGWVVKDAADGSELRRKDRV